MRDPRSLLAPILELHGHVRDELVGAAERQRIEALAAVDRDTDGDTIYAIDVAAEAIVARFAEALAREHAFVLVAEGLEGGRRAYGRVGLGGAAPLKGRPTKALEGRPTKALEGRPTKALEGRPTKAREGRPTEAEWVIIVDPIDGTRGLMYQKRSAWVLTAVAPNRGPDTSLKDVVLAVQTEVPLLKQHLSDQLWAVRGGGLQARRFNRLTREHTPIRPRPSSAPGIAHGYASIVRFFPGARDELAAIDEAVVMGVLGPSAPGKAQCFEDQYTSTGGQLHELTAGHDRFVADLRPLVRPTLAGRGLPPPLTCHPYDVCTALIAEENGVVVTDPLGRPLDVPLNVDAEVAWVGYANAAIRAQVEPVLQRVLRERGLIEE